MWQANTVVRGVESAHDDVRCEILGVSSHGDCDTETPLFRMRVTGIFTRALDEALLAGDIDVAVHSLKDVPTELESGIALAAWLPREDARDALVSSVSRSLADLPPNATVATGSIRRRAQTLAIRPDVEVVEVRGNVETRLRRHREKRWHGMIMAVAGLKRLGLESEIAAPLSIDEMVPAPAQGIVAVTCRSDDEPTRRVLAAISDRASETAAAAERALMRTLEGGCRVPIGALAQIDAGRVDLRAVVVAPDGSRRVAGRRDGPAADAQRIGVDLAGELVSKGADRILAAVRGATS